MSHSTIGRDICGVHLTAIHNSDHSGPTKLVLVKTRSDKVLGELEVPDGDMLVELALRIAIQRLTDIKEHEADSSVVEPYQEVRTWSTRTS